MSRHDLPDEADNYDVWCERCQRVHSYYSLTKQSYDRMVFDVAKSLADATIRQIEEELLRNR